jgi:hypothetical protein
MGLVNGLERQFVAVLGEAAGRELLLAEARLENVELRSRVYDLEAAAAVVAGVAEWLPGYGD